jgi:hypothetical protein
VADDLAEVWRKAIDANVRYYQSWGRLAGDWLRELQDAARGLRPTIRLPDVRTGVRSDGGLRGAESPGSSAPSSSSAAAPAAVVLEADDGAVATGAVLVENHLAHPVTATVEAEPFQDEAGQPVAVEIDVLPRTVELAPGESTVVRVQAAFPAGAVGSFRSALRVPGLMGTSVPLVLRSRS